MAEICGHSINIKNFPTRCNLLLFNCGRAISVFEDKIEAIHGREVGFEVTNQTYIQTCQVVASKRRGLEDLPFKLYFIAWVMVVTFLLP